ncbi:MAG: hypothetical protein P8L31_09440 [Pseudomonadales bacterium]|nr:hypothetical protein [Pseudomonadales bacterium]
MIKLVHVALLFLTVGCAEPNSEANLDSQVWPTGHSDHQTRSFFDAIAMSSHSKEMSGLAFEILQSPGNEPIAALVVIDLERFTPALLTAPSQGHSVQEIMTRSQASLVIGSGFVTDAQSLKPVGLLRVNNLDLTPLEPYGYTRILGFSEAGFGVRHRKNYVADAFTSAIQAGPGIIEHGELDISERDLQRPTYYRSFVALCSDSTRVGVSTRPTHLRTLGQVLLKHFADNDLSCPEVVNLAGDRQAVLAVHDGRGFIYHGDITTPKATLLSFTAN